MAAHRWLFPLVLVLAGLSAPAPAADLPSLCVYDFASPAGQEANGRKISEIIRGNARRSGEYSILVEIDREEVLEQHPFTPSLATPAKEILEHAQKYFRATRVVYGEVRATGGDALQVSARVIEAGPDGAVRERFQKTYAAANRFELVLVGRALVAEMAGRPAPQRPDQPLNVTYKVVSENLVPNPSFEQADPADPKRPARWTDASQTRQATWGDRPEPKPDDRKCLVLHPDRGMAETYGLIWYSDYIPVEKGAAYVLSMDLKAEGPVVIIWLKGYTEMKTESGVERRNTYKYQKRFHPEEWGPESKLPGGWTHWKTEPFVPKHPVATVQWLRVMLYAYLSPGQAYFDHVDLRKVQITSGELPKADFETPEGATEGWRIKTEPPEGQKAK